MRSCCMLTANEIMEWDEAGVPAVAQPLLDVDGLSKSFGANPSRLRSQSLPIQVLRSKIWRPWQKTSYPHTQPSRRSVVDAVTFQMHPRMSAGIVGAAGAGKSTLARLIVGQLPPDAGTATRRCRVQLMPQDGAAFFPARQTIANVVAAAFSVSRLSRDAARAAALPILERVGLTPGLFASETMARLSRGQRQRVAIALALIGDPQLIILDEPTAGLDAVAAAPLVELLQDLRLERDLTYLVLTRDADVAKALGGQEPMPLVDGRLSGGAFDGTGTP
jgi:ABC-type glutathione transport system ATPase component